MGYIDLLRHLIKYSNDETNKYVGFKEETNFCGDKAEEQNVMVASLNVSEYLYNYWVVFLNWSIWMVQFYFISISEEDYLFGKALVAEI